jgi:hypothetical protein
MTGRDLISASLRKIGALASGDAIPANDASDGLSELNRMIASWSTEGLLIYAKIRETLALTPGTATYSMGTGATLNTTRPMRIESASIMIGTIEYPLEVITDSQYAAIQTKSIQGVPTSVYPEGTYPNETLNFYPIPNSNYSFIPYSWKALSSVASLDTVLSFPPGYEDALVYNFAMRLAPEYGKQPDALVAQIASESKAGIKRMNHRPELLRCDDAIVKPGIHGRDSSRFITGVY